MAGTERLKLRVGGMNCGHCVAAVEKALDALPGVSAHSVKVGSALVEFDASVVGSNAVVAAVADAGYDVSLD